MCTYGFLPTTLLPECGLWRLSSSFRVASSTLSLDSFQSPLRMTNFTSFCNSVSSTFLDANLPSELLYLFTCKVSAISCMALSRLVFSTYTLSIDICLRATCILEFDDSSSESPLSLLAICTHSTFSLAARYLFDTCCVLTLATCLGAHCALGLDDSVHKSLLPTVCTTFTLAFAIVLLLLLSDLSVTESSTDSTLIWLLSLLVSLAAVLWQDALARVKGILLHLYNSFQRSASPQDFVESLRATCAFCQVQAGIRETRLYHPHSGTLP